MRGLVEVLVCRGVGRDGRPVEGEMSGERVGEELVKGSEGLVGKSEFHGY